MADLAPYFFGVVMTILAVFLVLLVLVQRGRGGGLTGALGGVGGSSAFGAKAGDVFTKITVVAASIWIVVCVGAAYWAGHRSDALGSGGALITPPGSTAPPSDGEETTDDVTTGEALDSPDSDSSTPADEEGTADAPASEDEPVGETAEGE